MTNLLVSRICFGDNLINQQVTKPAQTVEKAKDNKLPDNAKIMIGLGALSTAILGGLLVHKCIKLNKLAKEYKTGFVETYQSFVHNGSDCKTAGKTIEESITNIYGKDCNIKPHTYDKSQEYLIGTQEYGSGYTNTVIAPNNRFCDVGLAGIKLNKDMKWTIVKEGNIKKGEIIISNGINKYGQRCVSITFPDRMGNGVNNAIFVYSKDKNLTPVQKDLLKLKDKIFSVKEKSVLQELTFPKLSEDKEIIYNGNFDAILSVIQHLANG